MTENYLEINKIYQGDSQELLKQIRPESIALSIWSPPYYVGKDYERGMTFNEWQELLKNVIESHVPILKEGGFMVVNIADILCFKDDSMPRIQLPNPNRHKYKLTKEEILSVKEKNHGWNRYKLAEYFGCSEQTIDRRLNGNNIRGGKYHTQTRVFLSGGIIEKMAYDAGLYLGAFFPVRPIMSPSGATPAPIPNSVVKPGSADDDGAQGAPYMRE